MSIKPRSMALRGRPGFRPGNLGVRHPYQRRTQVFNAPEEVTSIDQLLSEFMDSNQVHLESSAKQQAYSQWYQDYKSNADIQINDMPERSCLRCKPSMASEPSSTSASTESDASTPPTLRLNSGRERPTEPSCPLRQTN